MSEWPEVSLTDIYEISSGLSKPADSFGSGYPFLSFKDVFGNYFIPDKLSQLVESSEKERLKGSIKRGDVFLTRTSETMHELGMSSVALKDYPEATFNGFTKRLRLKEDAPYEVHPEFMGYCLRSPKFRRGLLAFSTMSTRASLNNDMIGRLTIELPQIEVQKNIANVLKSLDDKIELNRQTNQTLEQIAQAIFKSWFVDFEPVKAKIKAKQNGQDPELAAMCAISGKVEGQLKGLDDADLQQLKNTAAFFPDALVESELGAVPEGWGIGVVGDLFELHRGFDLPKIDRKDGTFPVFAAGGYHGQHDHFKLEPPGIITGRSGVIGNVYLSLERYWPLNTTLYVREFKRCGAYYAYFYLQSCDLKAINSGSAVPSLNRNFVHSLPCFIPDEMLLVDFEKVISTCFKKIKSCEAESEKLSLLRDSLLPKLLSGKLNINNEAA